MRGTGRKVEGSETAGYIMSTLFVWIGSGGADAGAVAPQGIHSKCTERCRHGHLDSKI
jgi:hypothetical protein